MGASHEGEMDLGDPFHACRLLSFSHIDPRTDIPAILFSIASRNDEQSPMDQSQDSTM